MTPSLSDEAVLALLNRVASGPAKEAAAKMIYQSQYELVWSYVRAKCQDEQGVEEVVQDVFLAVFNRPGAFEAKARFSTWLLGIASFKLVDWQRSHFRHATRRAELDDEMVNTLPAPDWDFVAQLEQNQLLRLLRTRIGLLPALYREFITCISLHELTDIEAPELLQCPRSTVKSRLSANHAA